MALFKNKFIIKTWQELSASVAGDASLSFKPVKKLPKKLQQGKHNYKTKQGWFRRQKIKESPSLKSGTGELSQGFFIYDSGSNVAYSGYPSQSFMDDMMDMLSSQSFSSSAFNQMSSSFTSVNWPDIVVIQEEYSQNTASVQVGWDRVGVVLSSSNWGTDAPSASVNFINTSTDDIGMIQSYNVGTSLPGTARPEYSPVGSDRIHPVWEFTLPVTTASFTVKNDNTTSEFSTSFHLTGLASPGYTASDGTVNEAYTQAELLESLEWGYTGSSIFGGSPIALGKGIGDASQTIPVTDHDGNLQFIESTQQEVKTKVLDDNINTSAEEYPSTIAIFCSFGTNVSNLTSSNCKRYDYNDLNATGSFENVTIYYHRYKNQPLGLGSGSNLGSFIFGDADFITAATPGVYKDFSPPIIATTTASGNYRTTQTTSMNPLIRFSGSTI